MFKKYKELTKNTSKDDKVVGGIVTVGFIVLIISTGGLLLLAMAAIHMGYYLLDDNKK